MDQASVNFNRLLLGGRARETVKIVNKEFIPFSFAFDKASFQTEGQQPVLTVSPLAGVVGPGASFPVEVVFKPNEEKTFNYNVVCNVKRKAQPVVLNVKGEGYKIHAELALEDSATGRTQRILNAGVPEQLDFGPLQVHEKRSYTLVLSNKGSFNFDYVWQVKPNRGTVVVGDRMGDTPPYVSISTLQGVAEQDKEVQITIEYAPLETHVLDGTQLKMLIPSGPGESSYVIVLSGQSLRPRLDFSFQAHDFGPCFVKRGGGITAGEPSSPSRGKVPHEKVDLIVTNRDTQDHQLSTTFARTPYLEVDLQASMIERGQSIRVPIIFT